MELTLDQLSVSVKFPRLVPDCGTSSTHLRRPEFTRERVSSLPTRTFAMATTTPLLITISGRDITPAAANDCEPELRRPSRTKRALAIEMAPFSEAALLADGEPSVSRRRSKLGRLEATMAMLKLGPLTEGVCVCACVRVCVWCDECRSLSLPLYLCLSWLSRTLSV